MKTKPLKKHWPNNQPEKQGRSVCGAVGFFMEYADQKNQVDCKVCRGLLMVEAGRIDQLPFGGDLDKNGNERKHKGRERSNEWVSN